MAKIPDGCVLLARKILNSDIWNNKPIWFLKVWIYILMRVNHSDNKYFKRGENFFSYKMISEDCKIYREGYDHRNVDNVVRWLKLTTQITTQKTTRGIIIKVKNYEYYQNMNNYINQSENDSKNDTENDLKTTQKRHRNDTINKNVINVINDKELINTISPTDFAKSVCACINACLKITIQPDKLNKILPNWEKTYSSQIDVISEINKAEAWLISNSRTKHNYIRFLTNWFNRCLDKPGTKTIKDIEPYPVKHKCQKCGQEVGPKVKVCYMCLEKEKKNEDNKKLA